MKIQLKIAAILILFVAFAFTSCNIDGAGEGNGDGTNPTYTVTYDGNGSTGGSVPVDPTNYEEGQLVTVLGNTGSLVKAGYSFTGWNTQADGNGTTYTQGQIFLMGTANVTLFAKWTANPTYTVTYDGNGSTGGSVPNDPANYEEGQLVTVLGNTGSLVKAGYSFVGWNTQTDGNGTTYTQGQEFAMGTANVTLFAKWIANPTYTVIYDGNGSTGGSVPNDPTNYEEGQLVTVLGNTGSLLKTGYSFVGWNTQADGNGTTYTQGQQFTMGTANVTLFAKWIANPTYTVTYNDNGSTSGSVPIDASHYEEGQIVTVPGNTGYLLKINVAGVSYCFAGWNTQPDGNGTNYTQGQIFVMGGEDVVLYAKWTAYTLRDTGPAGGLICYDKGAYSNGWRYIEAAPSDLTSRVWGTYPYTVPGAAGTAIGTGIQNTLDIINGDPLADKAADECDNYSIENGGVVYDDWFLPSKDELNLMYVNLHQHGVGGFTTSNTYWSSSEYEDSAYNVWVQNFSTGSQGSVPKKYVKPIRAVRVF